MYEYVCSSVVGMAFWPAEQTKAILVGGTGHHGAYSSLVLKKPRLDDPDPYRAQERSKSVRLATNGIFALAGHKRVIAPLSS